MELGPIFRTLIHHKTRFWLIVLEIGLTLAVVANCVHMIQEQRALMLRPTGMDEEQILVARAEPYEPRFEDEEFLDTVYEDDLRALRALPGVRAVTGTTSIPLSGSGSATGRMAPGAEEDHTAPYFVVGTDVIEALGVELAAGRAFTESDFVALDEEAEYTEDNPFVRNVIVTQAMADVLYPDGDALGKTIQNSSGTSVNTVVGIVRRMHGSWPLSSVAERVVLFPGKPQDSRRTRYLIRAEPGMLDDLYTSLEDALLGVADGRLVTVRTLKEIKANLYLESMAMVKMLGGLSVLLVIVTSLGIIGLTSFSVTQRTHEIGTRRALGATRMKIVRYFLVENWLITTVGLALGLVFTYGLNYALANFADVARIGFSVVGFGMLLLWVVGLIAALAPAVRGASVPPVIATKSV